MMLALAPSLVRMSRAEAGRPEPIVDLIDERLDPKHGTSWHFEVIFSVPD
jgi:hypothetical protein